MENPISDIADISKTTVHEWDGRQSIFDVSGKLYDDSMATKITEFMWTTIDKAFEYSNKYKDAIPSDKSLLDFFYEQVEKTDFTQAEKDACIEVARLWGSYVGDPIERQSLKFFLLEECIDGSKNFFIFHLRYNIPDCLRTDNLFVASTYKDILKHVSATATQHADIHLNEPVVGIEAHPRQPNVDHQVTVTTAAGKQYKFDDVVVTCPLGWLKRNKGAFTPKLPPRLLSAIDSISYGRLEKIYVTFPDAFWHVTPGRPSSATGDANGATEVFYESHPEENHPPAFSIFLNPSYAEHPNEIPWNQESVSLAALPEHCAQPTLLFYIYGPCATQVVSEIKDLDSSSEMYYTFLNNFLLPYYSRLPRYSPTSPNCKPVAFLATQWQNDPYAGNGSYSNFQVGLEQGDRDIEVLRNGNGIGPDRGVWFAGEHTAPFVALGTTTGAYWSGERAAAQICDAYGLKEKVGLGNVRDDSLPSAVPKGTHAGALDPAAPEWSGRKQHETDHGV